MKNEIILLIALVCVLSFAIGFIFCLKFYVVKKIGGYAYPIVDSEEYEEQVAIGLQKDTINDICEGRLKYVTLKVGNPIDPRKKRTL